MTRRERRFWSRVKISSDPDQCWEWQGQRGFRGYGQLRFEQRGTMAHRVAYRLFVGPIPDGLFVCHKCDNPPCCNPWHLWVGTRAENMADMVRKGHANGPLRHSPRNPRRQQSFSREFAPDLTPGLGLAGRKAEPHLSPQALE